MVVDRCRSSGTTFLIRADCAIRINELTRLVHLQKKFQNNRTFVRVYKGHHEADSLKEKEAYLKPINCCQYEGAPVMQKQFILHRLLRLSFIVCHLEMGLA